MDKIDSNNCYYFMRSLYKLELLNNTEVGIAYNTLWDIRHGIIKWCRNQTVPDGVSK